MVAIMCHLTPLITDVKLHLGNSVIKDHLVTIKKKWDHVIDNVDQAMSETPPINDLRRYLSCYTPTLKAQLEGCKTNGDILKVVRTKCSLSNIDPFESLVNQFKVDTVKPVIEEYKASIKELYDSIPLQSYLNSSANRVTIVIDQVIDDETFNDIENLLTGYASQYSTKLIVIKESN